MKFGIFYEHQLPRPGDRRAVPASAGSRSRRSSWPMPWATTTPGRSSTTFSRIFPLLGARGVSRRGQPAHQADRARPRRGQLTTNQPHRVAERVATLDLLSGGRVDLGMGEAAGPAELHPFNIRVRDNMSAGKRR